MKKYLFTLLLLAAAPLWAQSNTQVTVASAFDLDGEAADADHIVTSATLADSTSFTVAASPDTCRLVDMTVTDADSSTTDGTITITGTDCFGDALTATYTFDGSGSGVVNFTVSSGSASAAYFKTVTSVASGVLTGEGVGDAITVGYTTNSPLSYLACGIRKDDSLGTKGVDPFSSYEERRRITTSGASSATVTSVNSDAPFTAAAVGDILLLNISGSLFERKITAKASANSITIDTAVTIPAAGIGYRWKQCFVSSDPTDNLWFNTDGYDGVSFIIDQDAEASTGDTVTSVECKATVSHIQIDTDTLDGAATAVSALDVRLAAYEACRIGLQFGTGDDADAAAEDINVSFVGQRIQ